MKIESDQSADVKKRWKIVRTDDYKDVEGEIVSADEDTGECKVMIAGEVKPISLGPNGMKIVGRRR